MFKKSIKISASILVMVAGTFVTTLAVTKYRPKSVLPLLIKNNKPIDIKKNVSFSITTFNIGYCGMDKDRDFFMDGGKGSRSSSKKKTIENLQGITDFLIKTNSDINFIQEVDVSSTRSYRVNEYDYIINSMNSHNSSFAYNYKVLWVPVPVKKPHGYVKSGVVTLSKFNTSSSTRFQYPGSEPWLKQLADLKRCFIESRLKVTDGKELILVNSHLSAYDKGGKIRKQQLDFLNAYIVKEYDKGNYVIVGGDWNHLLPGTDPLKFKSTESWPNWLQKLPDSFKPNAFKWAVDADVPTTRTDSFPYKKNVNFSAVIDGFLVSPNVDIEKVMGHDLEFNFSDHNPVTGTFVLR